MVPSADKGLGNCCLAWRERELSLIDDFGPKPAMTPLREWLEDGGRLGDPRPHGGGSVQAAVIAMRVGAYGPGAKWDEHEWEFRQSGSLNQWMQAPEA